MNAKIIGTGSYIPSVIERNSNFNDHEFLDASGAKFDDINEVIIEKFKAITGIGERRYVKDAFVTSDIASFAAANAIDDAQIDPETLNYIIVAHNFGDIKHGTIQADTVPSLAARVKHALRIKNPYCVAYDMLFGCPGWVESVIQANTYIKAGMAQKCLVIGAETLSRVVDKHDRDSMIYSDGAGAVVMEATLETSGVLAHHSATYTYDEAYYLFFGKSYNNTIIDDVRYIKMYGRKIYEFAITHVPEAMKACLDKSGVPIDHVKKFFIHQANEKMDEVIIKKFYQLYKAKVPEGVMPMNIQKMGNSSVATIPTLFDTVRRGMMKNQEIHQGDVIIFASVGAGMNINAIVYRC